MTALPNSTNPRGLALLPTAEGNEAMSKPNLTRRSLVTTAATVPALALTAIPAAAALSPTASTMPPTRAELVALGEQLKPLFVAQWDFLPKLYAAYRIAVDAADYKNLGYNRTEEQQKEADRRFQEAAEKFGYYKLYKQWGDLREKMYKIARSILAIEATDRIGDGIRAAAVLVLGDDDDTRYEVNVTTELL
jgi:hypothetical protein